MKVFNQNRKSTIRNCSGDLCEGIQISCSSCYEIQARGWRAALEEVLKQLNDTYDGDFENSEIVKWIEEEKK